MQSISLADELTLEPAPAGAGEDEVVCPGVPGPAQENLAARRAASLPRGHRLGRPAGAAAHPQADPRRGRSGRRLGGRGRRRCAWPRAPPGWAMRSCCASWARSWAPTSPRRSPPGAGLRRGAGERLHGLPDPSRPLGLLVLPAAEGLSTAEVYARGRPSSGRGAASRELEDRRARLSRGARARGAAARRSGAAAQRPPAGRDLAVSADRRCARQGARRRSARRRSSAARAPPSSGCSRAPTRSGGSSARRPSSADLVPAADRGDLGRRGGRRASCRSVSRRPDRAARPRGGAAHAADIAVRHNHGRRRNEQNSHQRPRRRVRRNIRGWRCTPA